MVHYENMTRLSLVVSLLFAAATVNAQVAFDQKDDRIEISIGGDPFSTFYFGPETTKPYLYPLRAPDGTIVTRGFPMEEIPGEQRDHEHQRSMWFTAVFNWNSPDGSTLLSEARRMVIRTATKDRIIDFDLTLTAVADKVHFGDTKEGTFAVRLATELEEPHMRAKGVARTGKITNAGGKTTEANTWGKQSPWVDYAGSIEGKPVGIAIFDHPSNPKHPTYWHVRGYGLFAANIFGEHHFNADDSRDGSITLAKGEKLHFRYRMLIHAGSTESAKVGRKYDRWASPKKK